MEVSPFPLTPTALALKCSTADKIGNGWGQLAACKEKGWKTILIFQP